MGLFLKRVWAGSFFTPQRPLTVLTSGEDKGVGCPPRETFRLDEPQRSPTNYTWNDPTSLRGGRFLFFVLFIMVHFSVVGFGVEETSVPSVLLSEVNVICIDHT